MRITMEIVRRVSAKIIKADQLLSPHPCTEEANNKFESQMHQGVD